MRSGAIVRLSALVAIAIAVVAARPAPAEAGLLDPFRCLKPPAIPPIRDCPRTDADRSELAIDFDYGQVYLSRAAVHVALYEQPSGAAVQLYGLCANSLDCLIGEYRPIALKALRDFEIPARFPGRGKIKDVVGDRIVKAFDEDQYEDIAAALDGVAEEGGCLDVQFRSGINWSTRGRGDERCRNGLEFGTTSDKLDLIEPYAGKKLFEISAGKTIRLTLFERTSAELVAQLRGCPDQRGCVETAFAIVLEEILEDDRIRGPVRAAILGVFDPGQATDFLDVAGGGRCLGVTIDSSATDVFDWQAVDDRRYCNRGGDPL